MKNLIFGIILIAALFCLGIKKSYSSTAVIQGDDVTEMSVSSQRVLSEMKKISDILEGVKAKKSTANNKKLFEALEQHYTEYLAEFTQLLEQADRLPNIDSAISSVHDQHNLFSDADGF